MGVSEILTQIDREIARLQHARALLAGSKAAQATKKAAAIPVAAKAAKKKKRNLTPEGRKLPPTDLFFIVRRRAGPEASP